MGEAGGSSRDTQPPSVEGRSMAVLYGSETGNAEDIAAELGNMARRLHFQTTVDEMDGFKLADVLRASLVIFVTSTTGQGDMPKNALKFWRNLRREKLNNTNCLRSLRFAIFGLGDSSYLKFNWAARKLRARLLQLGAIEFFRPGEGDERHDNGIDSIYLPWSQELKAAMVADYPLPDSVRPIPDDVPLAPKYSLELMPSSSPTSSLPSTPSAPSTPTVRMDVDEAAPRAEDERMFLASRTKSAARSHISNPPSAAEQAREDWRRLNVTFPAHSARADGSWERANGRPVDSLDKDNILTDHPEKYLLEPESPRIPATPPADLLPIPDTKVAMVVGNDRVTPPDHWQDVRRLVFHVQLTPRDRQVLSQISGEMVLTIWPKNYPEDVQELITLMDWGAVADLPLEIKSGATLRHLLTHNLDITAVPKRNFIRELIFFTNDKREKERLMEFTRAGNEQEFYDYTCRPRRTIIELLRDFAGVKIPFRRALDLFPVIRGRAYSVCNGGIDLKTPREDDRFTFEILAALVEYKTIIRKPRQGLCSRYLKHLAVGTEVRVKLSSSSGPALVDSPAEARRPLIAIATGTGIAPIRAVIQERAQHRGAGDTLLFFGCRNRSADFYFEREWPLYPNLIVYPAFSRDNIVPDPRTVAGPDQNGTGADFSGPLRPDDILAAVQYDANKNYVQHLIRKHAEEVGALMRRHPIVCVCGNAGRMPISVRRALLDALVISGVVANKDEAEKWFSNPENLTFWQEVW
ncbi:fc319fa7-e8b6-402d-a3e9-d6c20f5c9db6 [Thermothielavioides terrestris]|uniref:Fc319fa7-e8b6-402d-a3e9-d6c20f5c9db6 n=1 Tax=Thermothielavioides terrestris TaxID=2587410 RepID=A0A3S4BHA3_9PEZI|nr:fc319fa7-e8b6-402d-a3e9-d6c20f5c9db6 [Thermothielavioides terrestris]